MVLVLHLYRGTADCASASSSAHTAILHLPDSSHVDRARLRQAHVPQLALAGRQSATDLTQGLGPAHLAEQHGDELPPTAEPAGMPFRFVLADRRLKTGPRNEL